MYVKSLAHSKYSINSSFENYLISNISFCLKIWTVNGTMNILRSLQKEKETTHHLLPEHISSFLHIVFM